MDTKLDEVSFQVVVTVPEKVETVQYDINHLVEDIARLQFEISEKNKRIDEINALLERAKAVGINTP
jgi:peptidoglycan hydrolase CwlO-like protein